MRGAGERELKNSVLPCRAPSDALRILIIDRRKTGRGEWRGEPVCLGKGISKLLQVSDILMNIDWNSMKIEFELNFFFYRS